MTKRIYYKTDKEKNRLVSLVHQSKRTKGHYRAIIELDGINVKIMNIFKRKIIKKTLGLKNLTYAKRRAKLLLTKLGVDFDIEVRKRRK